MHVEQRGFWLWRSCGFHRTDRLPCGIDFLLVLSFFVQCVVLAYHHTFLLATTLCKCAAILLLLVRDDHPAHVQRRLKQPEHFVSQTRIASLAAVLLVILFVLLFALQYAETFASGHAFYRSSQLRQLNNDRETFNQPLLYHEWLTNHSRTLARGRLEQRRVLLVVIDGCRFDAMQNNAAMRRLWKERANDTWMVQMESALPTMSAPNWMTLLTGARPEITGLHGNIFPGETEFSTMMDMMARLATTHTDFLWGMTGCLWWSDMVKTRFPRLSGDGAVSSYSMYDVLRRHQNLPLDLDLSVSEQLVRPPYLDFQEYSSLDGLTDDVTDQHRTNVACDALNTNRTEGFRFFLVHLTNVDTQAHYYGVQSPVYNRDDTYNQAVSRTAGYLRQLLDAAHPDTTVVVTSDHGEVDAGGHGGVALILRQVPFVVFRKGSGIGKHHFALKQTPQIDDVAPTIMALLDLPAPRQSTGVILPVAWSLVPAAQRRKSLQDLYEARQELLNVFALQGRYTAREWCNDLSTWLVRNRTWARTASVQELEASVAVLDRLYGRLRGEMLAPLMVRNVILTALLCGVLLLYVVVLLKRHTLLLLDMRQEWKEALFGLALTCVYLPIVILVMYISYQVSGYPLWDSTWVHTVPAFLRFLLLALLPGSVVQFVLIRLYHVPFLDWEAIEPLRNDATRCDACCRNTWLLFGNFLRVLFVETAYQQGCVTDLTSVYFVRFYAFAWSVLTWCILLVLQGVYSFCVPFVFSNFVLTDETWSWRFRIVSIQLACMPLLIGNLATLCSFSRKNRNQIRWTRFYTAGLPGRHSKPY
jgi:hypothetical protein